MTCLTPFNKRGNNKEKHCHVLDNNLYCEQKQMRGKNNE